MMYFDKKLKEALVERAKIGATIQYGQLNEMLGCPYNLEISSERTRMGDDLGDISEVENSQGRPLLSSIVVNTNGLSGVGFFEMAERLKLFEPSKLSKKKFQEQEQKRVFEYWKNR